MLSRRTQSQLFEVTRPTEVHVYAVGEFCEDTCDHGWIEDAMTGEHVWDMLRDNTELAGGRRENRLYQGDLRLSPGVYRAAFDTDRSHAYKDWTGNPPYDPTAWGLTIWTDAPRGAVAAFDPWRSRKPFLHLTEVPDDVLRSTQFVVRKPVQLMAYAVGEISTGGSLYDYAWVENDDASNRVWEMSRDNSQPAGGSEKNRLEIAFLNLEPATYTVYYQTDGSHAFDDWNDDPPSHPERWGVTLFSLTALPDSGVIDIIEPTQVAQHVTSRAGEMPPLGEGKQLVRQVGLGNEVDFEATLELDEETRLRIKAVGEMSHSGRYDYGWIERVDTGETVWEMTMQNTRHAGGDDRNRLFDNIITLPEGAYKVHFKTDFSHAAGDFDEGGPTNPADWGIVVEQVDN
jgi:hypothetical protein